MRVLQAAQKVSTRFTHQFKMNFLKTILFFFGVSFMAMIVSEIIPVAAIVAMPLSFAMFEVVWGMLLATLAYVPISIFLGNGGPTTVGSTLHYAALGTIIVGFLFVAIGLTWGGILTFVTLLDIELGFFFTRTLPASMLLILATLNVCLTVWFLSRNEKTVWWLH